MSLDHETFTKTCFPNSKINNRTYSVNSTIFKYCINFAEKAYYQPRLYITVLPL